MSTDKLTPKQRAALKALLWRLRKFLTAPQAEADRHAEELLDQVEELGSLQDGD